ncbi:hypothetical protein [Actinomadura decatromicini]|uniref:Uncharacterized protein n=1 Tax=Actinomadura decatromicini TaxID=2604572 RepID=A0A5D3FBA3_9ACTN|nr:hypothetical protein [Actinomadura decatromicini]TYK45116.1 hypothetical protein FXF68_31015 [Actinomadura decatromicini]
MTVPGPAVDLRAVEQDIAAVLLAYGLGGHNTVQVAASEIEQGGHIAGLTVSALAYTRPPGLPTEEPERDPFGPLADQLTAEATS